jgi:hypothetical protein
MTERSGLGSRRFGWLIISGLTTLWSVGALLWLQSLWDADSYYARLSQALPGVVPAVGWTLTFTLAVTWGGLLWMRHREKSAPVPQLTPEALLELNPGQFEKHVALIFRHKGYRVRHRGKTGDHGVDLEVFPNSGRLGIVQCKRYRSTVGERVVRDLYGTMLHEGAAHAFLVTAGDISAAAEKWASDKPMTLVDGKRLLELARELAR